MAQTPSRQDLEQALRNASRAGDAASARRFARALSEMEEAPDEGMITYPSEPEVPTFGAEVLPPQREARSGLVEFMTRPPEDPGRSLQIGTQAVLEGAANLVGLPTDIGTGIINLVGDAPVPFGGDELWQFEESVLGSEWLRNRARNMAESAGLDVVERDEMAPAERRLYDFQVLGTESMAGPAAASRTRAADTTGSLINRLTEPYRRRPAESSASDLAASAAVAGTIGAAEEGNIPVAAAPLVALLVGGGAGAAVDTGFGLTRYGIGQIPENVSAIFDRSLSPEQRERLMGASRAQVDEAARRLQASIDDPEAVARNVRQNLGEYEQMGVVPPDTAILATTGTTPRTEANLSVMATNARLTNSADFIARDTEVRTGASRLIGRSMSDEAADFVGDSEAPDSPLREWTDFAPTARDQRLEEARGALQSAEQRVRGAQGRLREVSATLASRGAAAEGERASTQLYQSIVDDAVAPFTTERNRRYAEVVNVAGNRPVPDEAGGMEMIATLREAINSGFNIPQTTKVIVDRVMPNNPPEGFVQRPPTYADLDRIATDMRSVRGDPMRASDLNLMQFARGMTDAFGNVQNNLARMDDELGAAIRDARNFERVAFAPYFRAPTEQNPLGNVQGQRIREARNRDQLVGREENFAGNFFFGSPPNATRAAEDIRNILRISTSGQEGLRAAQRYLIYNAARASGRNGQINPALLKKFIENNRPVIEQFPEVQRDLESTLRRLNYGEGAVDEARTNLDNAARNLRRTEAEVDRDWVGLTIGVSPRAAVRKIFSAMENRDQYALAESIMRDIRNAPEADRARIRRSFQDTVLDYIRSAVQNPNAPSGTMASDVDPTSLAALNRELRKPGGALDILFEGNPEGLQALADTRRVLRDLETSNRRALAGPQTAERLTAAEKAARAFELPVRLVYGHLRGGGVMRSLRLAIGRIPGLDSSESVNEIMGIAFHDPDFFLRLVERRVPDPEVRRDILNNYRNAVRVQATDEDRIGKEEEDEVDGR